MRNETTEGVAAIAVKITPPAGVVAATVAGITLEEWVYILTIVWSVLGIIHHIVFKWVLPLRDRRAFRDKMELPGE